ncbi:MAG: hypothetical protein ABSE92_11790 [Terriglobales bacterium]|jgi:hypothetical protein
MTRRAHAISVLFLLGASLIASAGKEQSLQELVDHAQSARPEDRPVIYVEIMDRQLKVADQLYREGKVSDARGAVGDVVIYADKAHDAALATSKKLKGIEISLRKAAAKLRDIRRSLAFENQGPVQAASEHIEQLRTDLLNHMFAKD